jgi:hypothetical protein
MTNSCAERQEAYRGETHQTESPQRGNPYAAVVIDLAVLHALEAAATCGASHRSHHQRANPISAKGQNELGDGTVDFTDTGDRLDKNLTF